MLNNLLVTAKPDNFNIIVGDKVPRWRGLLTTLLREKLKDGFKEPQKPIEHGVELRPANDTFRPFPEEWELRGVGFTNEYFESDWFNNPNIETKEHYLETKSVRVEDRPWRVLWLGVQITDIGKGRWITYNYTRKTFSAS
jgi:hypothetical protein